MACYEGGRWGDIHLEHAVDMRAGATRSTMRCAMIGASGHGDEIAEADQRGWRRKGGGGPERPGLRAGASSLDWTGETRSPDSLEPDPDCPSINAIISCLVMRPPKPVPSSWDRLTLCSRAILRTRGEDRSVIILFVDLWRAAQRVSGFAAGRNSGFWAAGTGADSLSNGGGLDGAASRHRHRRKLCPRLYSPGR